MKTHLFRAFILMGVLCIFSCTEHTKDSKDAIAKACQGMNADEVKKIDDISEECKAAIAAILPSPQENMLSRIFNIGYDDATSKRRMILSGTKANGSVITADEFQDIELYAVVSGVRTKLPKSAYTLSKAMDQSQGLLSFSLVGDYSGSMAESDLLLVSELFSDFTKYLTPISEFEIIYFSSKVIQQQSLTSDAESLAAALQINKSIARDSTALYDGIGQGILDLSTSPRLGHVLIVGTDGMENSSQKYSKESIKALMASDKKLLIIMMGTFLSNITEMRELTGARGAFVYAQNVKNGKEAIGTFSKALQEAVVVEVSELYQSINWWEAAYGDASVQIGDVSPL